MSTIETAAPVAEAEQGRHQIFRYSTYVHVGPGAEECEQRENGKCRSEDHFHAWIRLPNPMQVRDIAEKAGAARARRTKMLKDPASDAYVILESELDMLREESARESLIGEIVDRELPSDYDVALRVVMDEDEPGWVEPEDEPDATPPKRFAHIDQDQEEYRRQTLLSEDERDEDYPQLQKNVTEWSEAIQAELTKLQEPRRERLREMAVDELVEIVRNDRISESGTDAYLHTYNIWQWFVCTYRPRDKGVPNERVYKDIAQFKNEAPSEVIERLKDEFGALEVQLVGDRRGNG